MPGDVMNEKAGAHHVMINTSTANARILAGVLLPKGAELTTLVDQPPVGMPATGSGKTTDWLLPALAFSLLCLALGGIYRSRRPANG